MSVNTSLADAQSHSINCNSNTVIIYDSTQSIFLYLGGYVLDTQQCGLIGLQPIDESARFTRRYVYDDTWERHTSFKLHASACAVHKRRNGSVT